MRLPLLLPLAASSLLLGPEPLRGQTDWDVTAPHGPGREIEFETDEGTWISLDVSPDGSLVVFDLLGDLYLLPIGGGRATLLAGGPAYETQPRFSPDGARIAYTSDRDGLENLWVMDRDGRNPRQVTRETERQVSNPAWTPDGEYLVGRKHYRNTRSLGAGEMWLYHLGGGEGLRLTERRNWEQNATEPTVSPDGRHVYYTEDVSEGDGFEYNRDPHGVIYAIQRYDRVSGRTESWLSEPGGSLRPQLSPDGRSMAFVRRIGTSSALLVADMESGRQRVLWDGLDLDQQEAWAIFGTYPGYAWTPDGSALVIGAQGGIWRIDAESGERARIPFTAPVRQRVAEALRFPVEVAPDRFDVRMLRGVRVSPDGGRVAYSALGKLWVKELPGGAPRRATRDEESQELFPAWSPDGRTLVYATWHDAELGAVRTVRADGGGERRLTARPGHYVSPSFSPDGQRVVFARVGGDDLRGELHTRDRGIYTVAADGGGDPVLVTGEVGAAPRFNRTGDRIFLTAGEGDSTVLASVNLNGADRRVHLRSGAAVEVVPSPDERHVAVLERFAVYLAPLPLTGRPVEFGPETGEYPVRRISRDAGYSLHWSADGGRVYWSLGPELHHRELGAGLALAADASPPPETPSAGTFIGFQAEADRPAGTLALVGGTAITMEGDRVIPDATVVVEGNRIVAVGPAATTPVPAGARTLDVSGAYLMPGIVDVHAHLPLGSSGITPRAHWGYLANLAFGVTTMHDPSSDTELVFSSAEMIRAGLVTAPRLFSTGRILYGGETDYRAVVDSYQDALSHLRRMKAVGAHTVKSYNQPRRDARQQLVEAARSLGMMVVPEGGSTYYFNMTHVLDGHTGIEHNIPVAPLRRDALTLMARSGTGYTPTLIVNYGGLGGEHYWYQESDVWTHPRLRRFVPRAALDARARRRTLAAPEDYSYLRSARSAKALLDAGGSVQLGSHGQLQGLGAHWELWMLGQGGMTPLEALRAATLSGAEYLGMDRDLGSLAPGKLADLLVLDRDPLADLRNSESIRFVVANGRVYDAEGLEGQLPAASYQLPATTDDGRPTADG